MRDQKCLQLPQPTYGYFLFDAHEPQVSTPMELFSWNLYKLLLDIRDKLMLSYFKRVSRDGTNDEPAEI